MSLPNNTHKKKEFISKPLKFVIASASIAGTIGLWGIFSKADVQTTTVQTNMTQLPAVATLVADNSGTSVSQTSVTDVNALPVITQAPVTSNYSASTTNYFQPAPVTSTRSSH